jgi:hypothetical protein
VGQDGGGGQGASEDAGNAPTLFAIDDQGNLTATSVVAAQDGGAPASAPNPIVPVAIRDTPKYELFGFDGLSVAAADGGTIACGVVILQKSSGALYCSAGLPRPGGDDLAHDTVVSNGGDVLFFEDGTLARVDMSSGSPTSTSLIDSTQCSSMTGASCVGSIVVNGEGDAFLGLFTQGGGGQSRVIEASNAIQNIFPTNTFAQWLAPSGHDFYFQSDPGTFSDGGVETCTTGGQEPRPITLATRLDGGAFSLSQQGCAPASGPSNGGWTEILATEVDASIVAYGWASGAAATAIVELVGPAQGTLYAVPGLATVADVQPAGGASFYVRGTDSSGNGGIVRIDIPAFTATTVVPPGDFSLTAMSASTTGGLTFVGQRNSDSAHVVGSVAPGASTYTIQSATAPVMTVVQRID